MPEIHVSLPKNWPPALRRGGGHGRRDCRRLRGAPAMAQRVLGQMSVRQRLDEVSSSSGIFSRTGVDRRRISEETGSAKPTPWALEVFPALDIIHYYERNAVRMLADEKVPTPLVLIGKRSRVFYEPLGTLLVISPWNYPFHLSFVPAVRR